MARNQFTQAPQAGKKTFKCEVLSKQVHQADVLGIKRQYSLHQKTFVFPRFNAQYYQVAKLTLCMAQA